MLSTIVLGMRLQAPIGHGRVDGPLALTVPISKNGTLTLPPACRESLPESHAMPPSQPGCKPIETRNRYVIVVL
jgi:hypothetical protein